MESRLLFRSYLLLGPTAKIAEEEGGRSEGRREKKGAKKKGESDAGWPDWFLCRDKFHDFGTEKRRERREMFGKKAASWSKF